MFGVTLSFSAFSDFSVCNQIIRGQIAESELLLKDIFYTFWFHYMVNMQFPFSIFKLFG